MPILDFPLYEGEEIDSEVQADDVLCLKHKYIYLNGEKIYMTPEEPAPPPL